MNTAANLPTTGDVTRGEAAAAMLPPAIGALAVFLALYPIAWLVYGSVVSAPPFSLQEGHLTLQNYVRAYADPLLPRTVANTLLFAMAQTFVSVTIGTALAWLVARTDMPGRRAFEFLALVMFLIPLLLAVVAWTLLLGPERGLINAGLVALGLPRFDIYSLGGMIFVQSLYLTPLAFLIVAPAFASIDAGLEESARMAGAGKWTVLWRVTLPLARPAILSATMLLFIIGLESFDVPQMLGASKGIYTFTSLIYFQVLDRYPADYGAGTALATSLLAFSLVCVAVYRRLVRHAERFETVRGKGYRAGVVELGRWRWPASALCWLYFTIAVGLPLFVLFLGSLLRFFGRFDLSIFSRMSLDNYVRVIAHPTLARSTINSLILAVGGGALCVLLAAVVSHIALKSRMRGRGLIEAAAMLPIAFPGTVLGLGLIWAYIGVPLPIYGTIAILLIAYVTRYLPIALRAVSGAVIQIGVELEEAGRMAGAGWWQRMRRIVLPLLKPALLGAWLLLVMILFRELPMSILLVGRDSQVISVVMYDFYQSGELGPLAATSVLMLAGIVVLAAVARRLIGVGIARG